MTDEHDHTGEVWRVDVLPAALRIYYVLGPCTKRAGWWEALILYDQPNSEEGQVEMLTDMELSGELFYWGQLL